MAVVGGIPAAFRPGRAFVAGILLCLSGAALAVVADRLVGLSAVLIGLVVGMILGRSGVQKWGAAGVHWSGRGLLQIGIVLLGARLSFAEAGALGWSAIAIAIGAVVVSLGFGTMIGRIAGLSSSRALLSAGAVGICGASAAMAIAALLPATARREQETVFTIAAVTTLSTAAMFLYPAIARQLGFDAVAAGVFFGAAIHDMAQVVGAGALMSTDAAVAATATKLVRVACLTPVLLIGGILLGRTGAPDQGKRPPLVPLFVAGFVLMALIANSGWLAPIAIQIMSQLAMLCLVTATVALGIKTSPRALMAGGWRPVLVVVLQTLLVASFVILALLVRS